MIRALSSLIVAIARILQLIVKLNGEYRAAKHAKRIESDAEKVEESFEAGDADKLNKLFADRDKDPREGKP